MQLLFKFIKELWPRRFHYFYKKNLKNQKTGGSVSLKTIGIQRNTSSCYFKNLKEPAGSIKDLARNW
jgi:hypothetical protein